MDSLRWTLLLIGIAIVAGIWWFGHRRSRERDETLFQRARRSYREHDGSAGLESDTVPDLDVAPPESEAADDAGTPTPRASASADTAPVSGPGEASEPEDADAVDARAAHEARSRPRRPDETAPDGGEVERLEVVYVIAGGGERFVGVRLQELFANQGLEHGELEIFHKRDAEGRTLFSVANLVEPGTFDPATMDTLSTPGLALFVRLPGPTSAEIAFDRMIGTARALADALEGRVLDQQHSTMTRQTEQHLRDQMRAFDLHRQAGRR